MPSLNDDRLPGAEAKPEAAKAAWRSLAEWAGLREFPTGAADAPDGVARREFLALLGASVALAGGAGCGQKPADKIVPYVRPPEEVVPGKPLFYATAVASRAHALGVLVETHEGRPVKVEGNPQHPASLGATDARAQATLLTLYDPDRSQVVSREGNIATWPAFLAALHPALEVQKARKGAGLRILTGAVTSPTLVRQLEDLRQRFPEARWHAFEPVSDDAAREGARLAFGRACDVLCAFEAADVVVSLEADFLSEGPAHVRYAHDFSLRRRVETGFGPGRRRVRLYVAESTPGLAGAAADRRIPVASGDVGRLARALAAHLAADADGRKGVAFGTSWQEAAARDLGAHRGRSLVLAGAGQPPVVHALAHGMNARLGNLGRTVRAIEPVEASGRAASVGDLVDDMKAGRVELLVIVGGNPAYDAPADLEFARHLDRVGLRVRLGLYEDETSALCHWHVPQAHEFEAWGDLRAYEGTASIVQPLIAPLYGGRSAPELLDALTGEGGREGYEIVRSFWKGGRDARDFEAFWRASLHEGVVPGTASPARTVALREDAVVLEEPSRDGGRGDESLEIVFRPDPSVDDGRFASNAWLQELPKPFTNLTWGNAALFSPAAARRLGLANEDVVELRLRDRSVTAPVWVLPGQAEGTVTVHLGHGRGRAGRVGTAVGFNAYLLRTSDAPSCARGLAVRKVGRRQPLASTQQHHFLEGRDPVRFSTLDELRGGKSPEPDRGPAPSLYPDFPYPSYAWGMAIDLNACVGCNACVVACQAENNVPVVGKEEVIRGREMHWLRIDHYFTGDPENPGHAFQPMLCQHCERAPCEVVCPVAATTHSSEGLNEMTYNRCVGTRYCSNNCPWKVRRFNFFDYAKPRSPSLRLLANPEVTVRSRGVMEKCTYCVQRINRARIEAKKEGRPIRDGEVVTACQSVCPAQAIVFGDINTRDSRVARLKSHPLNYAVLGHLNTVPRTTYLEKLREPDSSPEKK